MRGWSAVGALALVVVTAGCSGSRHDATPPTVPGAPAASGPASPSGRPSAPGAVPTMNGVRPGAEKKSAADGTWGARTGGTRVALYLFRGAAALNSPYFCAGTIDGAMRIALTCANGARDRLSGHAALGAGGGTLTVAWDAGRRAGVTDVFRRE
ncbi:hypothetical protein NE236_27010 [Actinoallomurus purpureus]|uniref:hypothetical protein n=1 Tax=Actinoallomurus purpureus TaxID=478114 RepID=UPI002092C66B|nr:hypothetical protein [Actinoallomurus purpureus]MCO6008629.1 hypothetical protein [Actinoallomurus purpureus]